MVTTESRGGFTHDGEQDNDGEADQCRLGCDVGAYRKGTQVFTPLVLPQVGRDERNYNFVLHFYKVQG